MGAEIDHLTTYNDTQEMMPVDGDSVPGFSDEQVPLEHTIVLKNRDGMSYKYTTDPQNGAQQNAAEIAAIASGLIGKSIIILLCHLYGMYMNTNFPLNMEDVKISIKKMPENGKCTMLSYEGREGNYLHISDSEMMTIKRVTHVQPNIESSLWILSELALKCFGRQG